MFLLFDIGGSKMRVAVSRDLKTFGEPLLDATPKSFDEGFDRLVSHAKQLVGDGKLEGIAGCLPGLLGREREMLLGAGNLKGWVGHPFASRLQETFGVKAYIENDADLVGFGEAVFGAGQNVDIVAYLTVSTGVGGGRIVDGKIDSYAKGFEPGYLIVDAGKHLVPDAETMYLEHLVSGTAFERRFGKKAFEVTDPSVWEEAAQILAYGLNNIAVLWSPDVIVLGGKMMTGDPAISLVSVRQHLDEVMALHEEVPLVRKAELDDLGGLWGAMALLKAKTE